MLKKAYDQGELQLHGDLAQLAQNSAWQQWLNVAVRSEWVVYAKPPFGGPEVVLKYLARYTHRVAISNRRLIKLEDDRVTFSIKDYAAGGRRATRTLTAVEFLRRFLLHVLPAGFMRIRHFGFLANRFRRENLERCRDLLGMQPKDPPAEHEETNSQQPDTLLTVLGEEICPACRRGRLHVTRILRGDLPHRLPQQSKRLPAYRDTS